jgi:predicted enzyme related to lactoylglutathione lyase
MKEVNPVNYFEIYVDDIDRARKFYETVLGKELRELEMPAGVNSRMMNFPWVEGAINTTGALVQMEQMKAGGNSTVVYFQCENCQVEQDRIEAAGGKVVQPKFPIGDYGFCSIGIDSEGNYFGLQSTL